MSDIRRELAQAIEDTLLENGIEQWNITADGKHNKYRFQWNGREQIFMASSTPSDWRCWMNAVSDLRRVLGVKRKVHKNPANRQRSYRKRVETLPKMPKVTIRPDPWEKLKERKVVPICPAPAAAPVTLTPSPLRRVWIALKGLVKDSVVFR